MNLNEINPLGYAKMIQRKLNVAQADLALVIGAMSPESNSKELKERLQKLFHAARELEIAVDDFTLKFFEE